MSDAKQDLEDVIHAIESTRREFARQRDGLEEGLSRYYADAGDVSDRLLSSIDEYGREHALQLMSERPDDYGDWRANTGAAWRDTVAGLTEQLDRLIETHERLDELTDMRERLQSRDNAASTRAINIQGDEYVIYGRSQQLERVGTGERFAVEIEPPAQAKGQTLIDRLAGQGPHERAQPRPDRDRDRSR